MVSGERALPEQASLRYLKLEAKRRRAAGEFTSLHHAQDMLRQQDARLAATYEHAGIGIAEVDRDGILLRVNARLCELIGTRRRLLDANSDFTLELLQYRARGSR